mmetsp:Transcript_20553/g.57019  ORF Transcript_20553/g.57019 Transcript_20553/m.57019 type:complete len:257 (+) Transcript_20553:1897-2667(+)
MLLNGHDLNGIVPKLADPRQDVVLEISVTVHHWFHVGHSHMALIDPERTGLLRSWILEDILLSLLENARCCFLSGLIINTIEWDFIGCLNCKLDPGRNPLDPLAPVCLHSALNPSVLGNLWLAVHIGEKEGEDTKVIADSPVFVLGLPVVEVTHQTACLAGRCPLSVPDASLALALSTVQTKELVTPLFGEAVHASLMLINRSTELFVTIESILEVVRLGPKRLIPFEAFSPIMLWNITHGWKICFIQNTVGARCP